MEINHDQFPVYELVELQANAPVLVLHVNGVQAICPFQPAMPMQGDYGKTVFGQCAGSSGCPLTKITPVVPDVEKMVEEIENRLPPKGTHYFKIGCGKYGIRHEVTIRKFPKIQQAPGSLYLPEK